MAVRYELVWKGEDGTDRSVPVGDLLTLGRGTRNDVVLSEEEVSWEHARFWVEGEQLYLTDVGSTNGTFVDERRIRDRVEVKAGARVRFGTRFEMGVRTVEGPARVKESTWIVEDLKSGVRRPLKLTLVVGDSSDADFRIAGAARMEFVAIEDGVMLVSGGTRRALRVGEVVEAPGVQLRLLEQRRQPPQRTARPRWGEGHYHVDASLDGRSPMATITDDEGNALVVEGETRATLVYVLAEAVVASRQAGTAPDEEGWLDDLDAVTKVWGRTAPSEVSNRLSVVVYRLRAGLKSSGLSPDFVERSRGRVRIRAARVSLG
ncbi:MAG: FHA domain-containing protein [Myxococcales bacterium]|nr:FHA domain-containing protein [Myxococcales bacterium]MCB9669711.1 FHA domain-containing protein [Alphaproteobacteria bacterium]